MARPRAGTGSVAGATLAVVPAILEDDAIAGVLLPDAFRVVVDGTRAFVAVAILDGGRFGTSLSVSSGMTSAFSTDFALVERPRGGSAASCDAPRFDFGLELALAEDSSNVALRPRRTGFDSGSWLSSSATGVLLRARCLVDLLGDS